MEQAARRRVDSDAQGVGKKMSGAVKDAERSAPVRPPSRAAAGLRFEVGVVVYVGIDCWRCIRPTTDRPGRGSTAWVLEDGRR